MTGFNNALFSSTFNDLFSLNLHPEALYFLAFLGSRIMGEHKC